MTPQAALARGMKDVFPILLAAFPYGIATGAVSIEMGFSLQQTLAMSALLFAGAAQVAIVQLSGSTPLLIILLAVTIINLRFAIYGATIGPLFDRIALGRKMVAAGMMTDQSFAFTLNLAAELGGRPNQNILFAYYMGTAILSWLNWQVGILIGALLGARLPQADLIAFMLPVMFIALLMPNVRDRPSLLAALISGALVVATRGLPFNLGLIVAALCGIAVGVLAEAIKR